MIGDGARRDAERAREIQSYLDIETDENIARGMSPAAARSAAQRKFGNATLVREEMYWQNTIGFLENLAKDLRYAVRTLRHNPSFSMIAILSLALGIGANTALFSLIDGLMLRSLPVPHPEQLMQVAVLPTDFEPGEKTEPSPVLSYPVFEQLRDGNDVFTGVAALLNHAPLTILVDGHEERAETHVVSGTFFSLLGIRPALGRFFDGAADKPGAEPIAVISDGYWQRRFAGDPHVLGKKFVRNNVVYTIAGVAPRGFTGVETGVGADLWLPLLTTTTSMRAFFGPSAHNLWTFRVLARVRPGLTQDQALAGASVRFSQIMQAEDREHRAQNAARSVPEKQLRSYAARRLVLIPAGSGITPLRDQYGRPLLILMGLVGLVLLIACANIANLLMARATARRREIAVRLAIGAGASRLFRQLLTESLLLAGLGAAAGLLFAVWASRILIHLVLGGAHTTFAFTLDWHLLAFLAGISLLTGLIFGVGPAWRATRLDVNPALKNDGDPGAARSSRLAIGRLLVTLQVAFSLVLLVSAALFVGTLRQLLGQDAGFERNSLILADFLIPRGAPKGPAAFAAYSQMGDRLRAMAGVQAVSFSDLAIFGGGTVANPVYFQGGAREGGASLDTQVISPGYFDTVGSTMVAGRQFTSRDDGPAPKVAIVNEAMARRYFRGESPIGKRFGWKADESGAIEIVGVVKDIKWSSLREPAPPFLYLPWQQPRSEALYGLSLAVRVAGDPGALMPAVRREIEATHLAESLHLQTQAELVESTLGQERLLAKLSGFFGMLGLLLAGVGLFGLISYSVSRRTREFGLRLALGARPSELVRSILGQTVKLVVPGLLLGAISARMAGRLVQDFLYQMAPQDPAVTSVSALLLLAAALFAAWLPARRAAQVDPMMALRHE